MEKAFFPMSNTYKVSFIIVSFIMVSLGAGVGAISMVSASCCWLFPVLLHAPKNTVAATTAKNSLIVFICFNLVNNEFAFASLSDSRICDAFFLVVV